MGLVLVVLIAFAVAGGVVSGFIAAAPELL